MASKESKAQIELNKRDGPPSLTSSISIQEILPLTQSFIVYLEDDEGPYDFTDEGLSFDPYGDAEIDKLILKSLQEILKQISEY